MQLAYYILPVCLNILPRRVGIIHSRTFDANQISR